MNRFNDEFKTKLFDTIEDIELNSHVEIVTIIKEDSDSYRDISIKIAGIVTFLVLTFMMFYPKEYDFYLIYFVTIFSFPIAYFAVELIPGVKKLFIKKKRLTRMVEIYGRALFQKGGIRFTDNKIGVLIFVSIFEKQVLILKDRGAESAIPDEESQKMNENFAKIFDNSNIADELLNTLQATQEIFTTYIPQIENDINELPDNLEINL